MPSKGVESYTYLTNTSFQMDFSVPKNEQSETEQNTMIKINQQVDSGNISGAFNYTGPYTWEALVNGAKVASKTNQISSLTGNLEGGDMTDMMNMPSIVGNIGSQGYAVSFGFYDAGPGVGGLTNQDQCYAYLTDSYESWMDGLVRAFPAAGAKPFHQFFLPGVHDAGMNTMNSANAILDSTSAVAVKAALIVMFPVVGTFAAFNAATAIRNLAITQKDSFTAMLNLGIRYFDFRPGYLYSAFRGDNDNTLYHQHNLIPGALYQDFLHELLLWLKNHPSEIVVLDLNTQGFAEDDMKPSQTDLNNAMQAAFSTAGLSESDLVVGGLADVSQTYQQLLDSKKRLIVLDQIYGGVTKYDSYQDGAYGTLTPGPILGALGAMNRTDQAQYDFTVLQIQGTATNVDGVIAPAVVSQSNTSSPLMSTKANFDNQTLPWLLANVNNNLSNEYLTVVLNDFGDNATVSFSISVTKQRMGL